MFNDSFYNNQVDTSNPYIFDLRREALLNDLHLKNIWASKVMNVDVGNLKPNELIRMTMYPDMDELFYIVQGQGHVIMGNENNQVMYDSYITENNGIFVPAGMWHQVINQYAFPLKYILISTYNPAS